MDNKIKWLIGGGTIAVALVLTSCFFAKDYSPKNVDGEVKIKNIKMQNYEEAPLTNIGIYKKPVEVKGVYLSEYTMASNANLEKWIKNCKEKEINSVIINIKNDDGHVSIDMPEGTVADSINADQGTIKDPAALVLKLKQNGIYPIARIVAFKDPYLAKNRPDLALKDANGNLLRIKSGSRTELWINPYNHEVWEYIVEVSKAAADVGFEEIQYDYIRFATSKQITKESFGPEGYNKDKEDIVLEFCQYAVDELKPYGVYVALDVFGTIITSELDASIVGQDYLEMSKIVDYICPMIYPSHYNNGALGVQYPDLDPYNTIKNALIKSNELLDKIPEGQHRAIVRPWLQDFTAPWVKPHQTYGPKQIREQINGTYDAGIKEWILWNAANRYTLDGLENR